MLTPPRSSAPWRMTVLFIGTAALVVGLGLTAFGQQQREWRDYAGGPDSSRFVAATADHQGERAASSQVAWTYPAGQTDFNPLVVRGVVYGRGPNGSFVALDAATGKQIWIHEGVQGFNSPRRELLGEQGRQGSPADLQHRATCSRSSTRRPASRSPSFGTDGRVDLRVGLDRDPDDDQPADAARPGACSRTCSSSGRRRTRSTRRRPATSARSTCAPATLVWTFHTVPRPGEFGYDTWPQDAWKTVGGANNWGEQSIDEKRGIVYVPTGEPEVQLLRRQPQRREPVRRLPHRARCADRQAALAFPDRPPRHLGSRQQLGAAADDHPPERPRHRRRRRGQQDRLPVRVRSRDRQADLADRGAAGAAEARRCRAKRCRRRSRSRPRRRRSRGRSSRPTI